MILSRRHQILYYFQVFFLWPTYIESIIHPRLSSSTKKFWWVCTFSFYELWKQINSKICDGNIWGQIVSNSGSNILFWKIFDTVSMVSVKKNWAVGFDWFSRSSRKLLSELHIPILAWMIWENSINRLCSNPHCNYYSSTIASSSEVKIHNFSFCIMINMSYYSLNMKRACNHPYKTDWERNPIFSVNFIMFNINKNY